MPKMIRKVEINHTSKKNHNARMCAITRKIFLKKDLVRLCKVNATTIVYDPNQNYLGRGLYFVNCPNAIEKVKQKKIILKVLKVHVDATWYAELAEQIKKQS